jgi:hypothetical protein
MTTENNEARSPKAPSHIAYQVRNGKEKGYFTRIGAAWPTKNGSGLNIQFDAVPLDGRVTLLPASEAKE